ncbi:MAG: VanW family protein [Chloroflexota bacterium]|nr:VanW family protein [Chloroflexota bacterium]
MTGAPAPLRLSLLLCILLLVGTLGFTAFQAQKQLPTGLIVAGVPLGGYTHDEAHAVLLRRAAEFERQTVTLRFQEHVWTPTLAELGVSLDTDAAWQTVQHYGSSRYAVQRTLRALDLVSAPIVIPLPLDVDPAALHAFCDQKLRELGMAPVDAALTVDGTSIHVTDDAGGFRISIDQFQQDLVRELRGFTQPTITLTAVYTPADVRRDQLQPGATTLGRTLENPLTLYTETDQWQVAPSELARHITLDATGESPRLSIDEEAIDALVRRIANDIDREAIPAHVSEEGTYPRLITPQDGQIVDQSLLRERILEALQAAEHEVEIPVTITPVDADIQALMDEYGLTDLIATGSSNFSGSDWGREVNVRLAARLIDGTLIAPGELFSFNHALGAIAEIDGFVPAGATECGIPGSAAGGGVCQVSTSIFRAALQAGMPIEEWWPHEYRSAFYETGGWAPGFDASITQPDDDPLNGADLKFRNATDGWMLVRVVATSGGELKVTLYGTNPGYQVIITDPVYQNVVPSDGVPVEEIDESLEDGTSLLVEPTRDGVTMVVYRTVYAADGTLLIDESFVSTYQPQGPVYRVSEDMAGTTGM